MIWLAYAVSSVHKLDSFIAKLQQEIALRMPLTAFDLFDGYLAGPDQGLGWNRKVSLFLG